MSTWLYARLDPLSRQVNFSRTTLRIQSNKGCSIRRAPASTRLRRFDLPQPQPCDLRHDRVMGRWGALFPCSPQPQLAILDTDARFHAFGSCLGSSPPGDSQDARNGQSLCAPGFNQLLSPMLGASRQHIDAYAYMSMGSRKQVCGCTACLGAINWVFQCSFMVLSAHFNAAMSILCAERTACAERWKRMIRVAVRCVSGAAGRRVRVREGWALARAHLAQSGRHRK